MRWLMVMIAAAMLMPVQGRAFDGGIQQSVVAVVPQWPGVPRGGTGGREAPEGTAVSVLPGGYLATNAHVLGRAEKVDIRLADGRMVAVDIVGRDPRTDIALIKAPSDFPVPVIVPPPALGEPVCAVGNQFGLGLSITCGVVSALHRSNAGFNPVEDFIQTDTAVNPGGSGGALVDARGRLVGMVSAIFTKKSDANIGVNFAAPMDLVMRVVNDLRDFGAVRAGRAGLQVAPLSADQRRRTGGARIVRLNRDGAALAAGLQAGDILTHVAGRTIVHAGDVPAALYMHRPGDEVVVRYRRGGLASTVRLRLKP